MTEAQFHDRNTAATDPGLLRLSRPKFDRQYPELAGFFSRFFARRTDPFRRRPLALTLAMLDEHLRLGDSRAATVMAVAPSLIVAAYTDELDCVVLLEFDAALTDRRFEIGERVLTVNTYQRGPGVAPDLQPGPMATGRYVNFYPLVAELTAEDDPRVANRKAAIPEEEWARTRDLGEQVFRTHTRARDGRALHSLVPRTSL